MKEREALQKIANCKDEIKDENFSEYFVGIAEEALKELTEITEPRMFSEKEVNEILDKHCIANKWWMTSNERHTVINAIKEIQSLSPKKGKEEVNSCSNCKHFYSVAPCVDQPYPEFACSKGHWDGVGSQAELDSLHDKTDCTDHSSLEPNQTEAEKKTAHDIWEKHCPVNFGREHSRFTTPHIIDAMEEYAEQCRLSAINEVEEWVKKESISATDEGGVFYENVVDSDYLLTKLQTLKKITK